MKLPKPGTKVEDLKCPKCKELIGANPSDCDETECPQKPPQVTPPNP